MSEINMSISSDAELLKKAQVKLEKMGIDFNTYFNTMLQKFVEDDVEESRDTTRSSKKKLIHFEDLPKEEQERRLKIMNTKGHLSEALGVLNGLIWMADDFDEPLECMKEYME